MLSLHYNGSNSFLFVKALKICQYKAKDSEIKLLCVDNILEGFKFHKMKKTVLKGSVKGFSVDYDAIDFCNILDIHRYSMKKIWHEIIFGFIKKIVY